MLMEEVGLSQRSSEGVLSWQRGMKETVEIAEGGGRVEFKEAVKES